MVIGNITFPGSSVHQGTGVYVLYLKKYCKYELKRKELNLRRPVLTVLFGVSYKKVFPIIKYKYLVQL